MTWLFGKGRIQGAAAFRLVCVCVWGVGRVRNVSWIRACLTEGFGFAFCFLSFAISFFRVVGCMAHDILSH